MILLVSWFKLTTANHWVLLLSLFSGDDVCWLTMLLGKKYGQFIDRVVSKDERRLSIYFNSEALKALLYIYICLLCVCILITNHSYIIIK